MKYTRYFEVVENDGNGYVVEANYEFNGEMYHAAADVETVSQGHTLLRQWRAEFRDVLDRAKQERRQAAGQEQVAGTH